MKTLKRLLIVVAILTAFTFSQCKKNKNEEAQLPPETQTGAMTFGCKINGKVFVPRDGRGKPGLIVQYAYLGNGPGGGWYLSMPATNWQPNPPEGVDIFSDSLLVEESKTYPFRTTKGSVKAAYSNGPEYNKLDTDSGSLTITKFDQTNRILSGRFFFTGTNPSSGEKVQVTEGRFDVRF